MQYPEGIERLTLSGNLSAGPALELIKRIIGQENLEVSINGTEELLSFLSNPERFVEDSGICKKVRSLNELLIMFE